MPSNESSKETGVGASTQPESGAGPKDRNAEQGTLGPGVSASSLLIAALATLAGHEESAAATIPPVEAADPPSTVIHFLNDEALDTPDVDAFYKGSEEIQLATAGDCAGGNPYPTYYPPSSPTIYPSTRPSSATGSNCFVATVAFGSPDASEVVRLRRFRDSTLSNYAVGRVFIRWYYDAGPKIANAVGNRPWVLSVIRSLIRLGIRVADQIPIRDT